MSTADEIKDAMGGFAQGILSMKDILHRNAQVEEALRQCLIALGHTGELSMRRFANHDSELLEFKVGDQRAQMQLGLLKQWVELNRIDLAWWDIPAKSERPIIRLR